jgi:hypothetical protein
LIQGTCLGFYRDKDYITNDYDIDIGVSKKNFKSLIHELRRKNFKPIYWTNQNPLTNSPSIIFMKFNMLLDVFVSDIKNFQTIKHDKNTYLIPSPVETYLKKIFDDWQTPRISKKKNIAIIYKNGHYTILWDFFGTELYEILLNNIGIY